MHDDLSDRTREYFNNPLLTAATYLDSRYRKLKFIKDESERNEIINKVKTYIISKYLATF